MVCENWSGGILGVQRLFKRADEDRKRSRDWKAKLMVVGLEIKELFLTVGITDHWNKEPRDVVNSLSYTALERGLATFLWMWTESQAVGLGEVKNVNFQLRKPEMTCGGMRERFHLHHAEMVAGPGLAPTDIGKGRQALSCSCCAPSPAWGCKISAIEPSL